MSVTATNQTKLRFESPQFQKTGVLIPTGKKNKDLVELKERSRNGLQQSLFKSQASNYSNTYSTRMGQKISKFSQLSYQKLQHY